MTSAMVKFISGLVGVALMSLFILGLAHSVSTGFAGFWGGLPFLVISIFVLALVVYNFWDECVRKNFGR